MKKVIVNIFQGTYTDKKKLKTNKKKYTFNCPFKNVKVGDYVLVESFIVDPITKKPFGVLNGAVIKRVIDEDVENKFKATSYVVACLSYNFEERVKAINKIKRGQKMKNYKIYK